MIIDHRLESAKVDKLALKVANSKEINKPTPISQFKLETSFAHNDIKCLIQFCTLRSLRNFINVLLGSKNYFCCPRVALSRPGWQKVLSVGVW